nr:hypothetical protein BaRGS_020031 [Batillaria attramentaria]
MVFRTHFSSSSLLKNKVVHVIVLLLAVFYALVHIYCLPADCEDAFFIPRTSKQYELHYDYVYDAGKLCKETAGSDVYTRPDVVIMVLTTSQNVAQRQAIRDTYGSVARGKAWPGTARQEEHSDPRNRRTGTARVVFLMGQTKDVLYKATEKETLAAESREYGDVVQWEGLVEDYSNLTLKVLLGLRWVRDMCPHAHHVVKTDDDIFIHLPRLFRTLQSCGRNSNFIHVGAQHAGLSAQQYDTCRVVSTGCEFGDGSRYWNGMKKKNEEKGGIEDDDEEVEEEEKEVEEEEGGGGEEEEERERE